VLLVTASDLRRLGFLFRGDKSLEYNAEVFFRHCDRLKQTIPKQLIPQYRVLMFENIGALYFYCDQPGKASISYYPFFDSPEEYYPDDYGRMRGYRTLMISSIVNSMAYSLLGLSGGTALGIFEMASARGLSSGRFTITRA